MLFCDKFKFLELAWGAYDWCEVLAFLFPWESCACELRVGLSLFLWPLDPEMALVFLCVCLLLLIAALYMFELVDLLVGVFFFICINMFMPKF